MNANLDVNILKIKSLQYCKNFIFIHNCFKFEMEEICFIKPHIVHFLTVQNGKFFLEKIRQRNNSPSSILKSIHYEQKEKYF